MAHKKPYIIEVSKTKAGKFNWTLWSGNGKMLAINPEPFARKNDLIRTLTLVKQRFGAAKVVQALATIDEVPSHPSKDRLAEQKLQQR